MLSFINSSRYIQISVWKWDGSNNFYRFTFRNAQIYFS